VPSGLDGVEPPRIFSNEKGLNVYHVEGTSYDDFEAAQAHAQRAAARLIQTWDAITGPQTVDVLAPYDVLRETETHLWVRSPLGEIGIPARRDRPENTTPAMAVTLRVCVRDDVAWAIQCGSVTYADATCSTFSGVVIPLTSCATAETSQVDLCDAEAQS